MGCSHVRDFIRGTTIVLPRPASQSPDREPHDILRPNQKAAELISRHVEVLEALNAHVEPFVAAH